MENPRREPRLFSLWSVSGSLSHSHQIYNCLVGEAHDHQISSEFQIYNDRVGNVTFCNFECLKNGHN